MANKFQIGASTYGAGAIRGQGSISASKNDYSLSKSPMQNIFQSTSNGNLNTVFSKFSDLEPVR